MARSGDKLRGLKILVAEDEERLADVLIDLIGLYGGTVAGPVASVEEAAALIDGARIDAAVLDVRLRSGPCFTLAEALLRRRIPVILITGFSLTEIPEPLEGLPIFTKPFRVEALVDCVADCCRTRPAG